jgi:isopropylmalate/homocitrate/citramalate synthase
MNTDHKLDTGTAQNLNSLLKDPSASTNNIGPTTKEKAPLSEYLQRLGDDHVEAGLNATADDIYEAAAEIRKLTSKVDELAAGRAEVVSREDQLASALFGLIEDRVQTFVENEVQAAIEDYDPTDHHNFSDAVAEQTADTSTESIREVVAEVVKNGYFDITFNS